MKAFAFRLEPARRLRSAQLTLQEARVSAAAAVVTRIETQRAAITEELARSAELIRQAPTGETLNAHGDFARLADRRLRELEKQLQEARRKLTAEMKLLAEARRKLRLIEDLKADSRQEWQKDLDRETAAFADESYLGKLHAAQLRLQSKRRAGA